MIKNLHAGMKLTIVWIDSMMAMTHRKEIEVVSVCEPSRHGYENEEVRLGTYKERGKRKVFYLDVRPRTMVFDGWDMPFRADTEGFGNIDHPNIMRGNACFNLVGDKETIRDIILTKQINNEAREEDLASVVICNGHDEELLFPGLKTSHAVINKMKEKAA